MLYEQHCNKNICGNVDGFLKFWLHKQGILFIINTENTWEYKEEENNILMYFVLVLFECIIFGCMCIFINASHKVEIVLHAI